MIRDFKEGDEIQIADIYNHYVLNTHHTFETETIKAQEMLSRILEIKQNYPFIVFEKDGQILAYAYASRWKQRQAYDHTVESSIYVHPDQHGKRIGSILYSSLLNELKQGDIHSVLAGISLPNDISIYLHEKLGFKKQGVLEEVGYKFDKWIDVAYWNLRL